MALEGDGGLEGVLGAGERDKVGLGTRTGCGEDGDTEAMQFGAHKVPPVSPQVRSPLSDSILGEQMLVVSEEKVTVTALHPQLVAGLSLTLRPEPGHPGVVTATTLGTTILRVPKQVRGVGGMLKVPGVPKPQCHPPGVPGRRRHCPSGCPSPTARWRRWSCMGRTQP